MPKPIAFITGIAGFGGSWLAEELLCHGYHVFGSVYENEPIDNLHACRNEVTLVPMDVLDADRVQQTLAKIKPHYIFHLAAVACVGKSFEAERLTFRVNFEGTLNMLEAARQIRRLKKMVWVGSSDAYGIVKAKTLSEDDPFNPVSPYGISKAAGDFLCRSHFRRHNLPVTIARAFNHSGPRQALNFVVPDFAHQVAAIDLGRKNPKIRVGNLAAKRDLSDVRDIVHGYRLLAENGQPGRVYQLCSGKATSIESILKTLLGFTARKVTVTVDKSKWRAVDIPMLRGSNRRAVNELGYEIRYSLKQTLRETFEYWKERLTAQKN